MLISFFKKALAPAVATQGLMHYWRGNYQKSCELLTKAKQWDPEITKNSIFEAGLGLVLHHLGRPEEAAPKLISAQSHLSKLSTHNKEIASAEHQMLKEINQVLSNSNVL
jgi:tetratricopeptide (TPR) repeat protein